MVDKIVTVHGCEMPHLRYIGFRWVTLISNLIRFDAAGRVSETSVFLGELVSFHRWYYMFLFGLLFVVIEIDKHGLRYFFPYLWGDFPKLKMDLKTLLSC